MGIYDAYQAPDITFPHGRRIAVPEHARLATASYQIVRGCFRLYLFAATCALLAVAVLPAVLPGQPAYAEWLPQVIVAGILACCFAHLVGFALGLIGLFQQARQRRRAIWGIFLNVFFPCCLITLAVLVTPPLSGIQLPAAQARHSTGQTQ